MAIKAIGTVTANPGDGRTVQVNWTLLETAREWYFYTNRYTLWRVQPGDWAADGLIAFAFDNKPQDINRFRNASYWKERFGDVPDDQRRFNWTRFYTAVADKLSAFRHDRAPLVSGIHEIAKRVDGLSNLDDDYSDGASGPLRDICPFTTIGIFNRGITDTNRKIIAAELAKLLGVEEPVPESFEGIPVLNNQKSWFFGKENKRQPQDIESLWAVFDAAIQFADSDNPEARAVFSAAYDNVAQVYGVGWNLTMGLYWMRPWAYPTLDSQSQHYIDKKLGMTIGRNGPKGRSSAADYLKVMQDLEARFQEDAYPVHSFPELSLAAWLYKDVSTPQGEIDVFTEDKGTDDVPETSITPAPIQPYSVDSIIADGCFLDRTSIDEILKCLRDKKNLILQGPPGTGKTWLAKRVAFALIGQRDESKIKAVQFHTNLSYEDFVRGWRPAGKGTLELVDGPFLEMIKLAASDPSRSYVIVIEEINRGNPAQIFGEMLTLLEDNKRTPDEALELSYRRTDGERVFIPGNLYVIGTMNIADRSLALVDFALRRRFAFIDLEPTLGATWRKWVNAQNGISEDILEDFERRIEILNKEISNEATLGRQFRIGHSYVTPRSNNPITDPSGWFKQVVKTEIGPLLDEYFYDAPDRAQKSKMLLTEGL